MSELVPEKVRAAVSRAIADLPEPTLDAVRRRLFPDDDVLDTTSEMILRATYFHQLRVALLTHGKNVIVEKIQHSTFAKPPISRFADVADWFTFLKEDQKAKRLLRALPCNSPAMTSLYWELRAFQDKLVPSSQPLDDELAFRDALVKWLTSGETRKSRDIERRKQEERIKRGENTRAVVEEMTAALFLQLTDPSNAECSEMKSVAFDTMREAAALVAHGKIRQILNQCCNAEFTLENGCLRVEGTAIAISLVIDGIRARLASESRVIHSVLIIATDCCTLDWWIRGKQWSGINLTIVTRRLVVFGVTMINLSGFDWPQWNRIGRSSDNPHRPGNNGKSGRAGQCSGNLRIITEEIVGEEGLIVKLNGASGEDGEHGVDGCKGSDGVGITEEEIRNMSFPGQEGFPDEIVPNTSECTDSTKHYEFTDTKERSVFYSANATSHLVFVQGSLGKPGSIGGVGGTGGKGGCAGNIHIYHFDGNDKRSEYTLIDVSQEKGGDGESGIDGNYGPCGVDGTDGVLHDGTFHSFPEKVCMKHVTETKERAPNSYPIPHLHSDNTYAVFEEITPERYPCSVSTMCYAPAKNNEWTCGFQWDIKRHRYRSSNTFDNDFREVQESSLKKNVDLSDQLEAFIFSQPSDEICIRNITAIIGKDVILKGFLELARIQLKNDHVSLIRILNGLITADYEQPCTGKWRAIIEAFCSLAHASHNCNLRVFAMLMACLKSNEVFDSLLHIRAVISTRSISLLKSSKLWHALHSVCSLPAKTLFLHKLEDAENNGVRLNIKQLVQLLLMLKHAEKHLKQLSQMPLMKWMDIANRKYQMLHDNDSFGPVSYYLEVLASAGLDSEEYYIRIMMKDWKTSHYLLGQFIHCLVSKEIEVHASFWYELLMISGPQNYESAIRAILPYSERRLDDMPQLVRGLQDTQDEANRRRRNINRIVSMMQLKPPQSGRLKLLAIVDDALSKTSNKRLRDVQKMAIMCALKSPQNLLQQVSSGEGKAYIISAIAAIRCLRDEKSTVHIITSSSASAERDFAKFRALYDELGLSVAHIDMESREERRIAYTAQIVYGTIANFQRDYLIHSFQESIRGSQELIYAIVDDVDVMTLDSGNNVIYLPHKLASMKILDSLLILIQKQVYATIDGATRKSEEIRLYVLREIYGRLSKEDLAIIDDTHADSFFAALCEAQILDGEGFILFEQELTEQEKQVLNTFGNCESASIMIDALVIEMTREKEIAVPIQLRDFVRRNILSFIENCKLAQKMRLNIDYFLTSKPSKSSTETEDILTIVDDETGADITGDQGLRQFLQMKHACRLTPISLRAVFVSNVKFLCQYSRIDGLSSTLGSSEERRTLAELYNADLMQMPTHKPRRFVEHIPKFSATSDSWIKNVYIEVSGVLSSDRTALVICETIDHQQELRKGLLSRNERSRGASAAMDNALDNMTVYTRQHDVFEYEDRCLEGARIILTTNLDLQGSDISINDELESNGGLHVVIAFLPRSQRLEDKAMGLAAQGGAPGSGQIIARDFSNSDVIAPALTDFKKHRDSMEVLRIKSLRNNFELCVSLEEDLLEKVHHHPTYEHKLFRKKNNYDRLPEAEDVIYSALQDKWAMWLDAKINEIKECAIEEDATKRDILKTRIFMAVDVFIADHAIEWDHVRNHVFPDWIQAGEWLLRLGLIQMREAQWGLAELTFNRVMASGTYLTKFALYYCACMYMQNLEEMFDEEESSLHLKKSGGVKAEPDCAILNFKSARMLFREESAFRVREVRMIEEQFKSSSASSGLQLQLNEYCDAVGHIIANIDWLIGEPLTKKSFEPFISSDDYNFFEVGKCIGLIVPNTLEDVTKAFIHVHYPFVRHSFMIGEKKLARVLENDGRIMLHRGGIELERRLALPNRRDFWNSMKATCAFYNVEQVYIVNEESLEAVKLAIPLRRMIFNDHDTIRRGLLYSNGSIKDSIIYAKNDIDRLVLSSKDIKDRVHTLLNEKCLKLDDLASIDVIRLQDSTLQQFDGFTYEQFKEHFDIEDSTCRWVLDQLITHGVIEENLETTVNPSNNWKIFAAQFQWTSAISPDIEVNGFKLAGLEAYDDTVTISPMVLPRALPILSRMPIDNALRVAQELFDALLQRGILEEHERLVYRKAGELNCSMLPSAFASLVRSFLLYHFTYTIARDKLLQECAESETPFTVKKILLSEDPHQELFDLLCGQEIISPPRIISQKYQWWIDRHAPREITDKQGLKNFMTYRRSKLHDDNQMFNVIPIADFISERCITITSEMKALIDIGMVAGVSMKKLPTAKKGKTVGSIIGWRGKEYYYQGRMDTPKTSAQTISDDTEDKYFFLRTIEHRRCVVDSKCWDADAKALIDQTMLVAKTLKATMMSSLVPPPTISFPGLREYLELLENKLWFESELTLCIQWTVMEALRALSESGQVVSLERLSINCAALTVAYAAMLDNCEHERANRRNQHVSARDNECLSTIIKAVFDAKMRDIFTNPIVNFIRCIMSENTNSNISQPVLSDEHIVKTACQLRKPNSSAWLNSSQRIHLMNIVHATIANIYMEMKQVDNGIEAAMKASVNDLTRLCLIQRFPMSFEPCFSILRRVSADIDRCFEDIQTKTQVDRYEPSECFICLSESDYTDCREILEVKRSINLFDLVREHSNTIYDTMTLRHSLIKALSKEPNQQPVKEELQGMDSTVETDSAQTPEVTEPNTPNIDQPEQPIINHQFPLPVVLAVLLIVSLIILVL